MIRSITSGDRALFLEMAAEFYASPAVAHPVPAVYHTRAFAELMRSDDYMLACIIEHQGVPVGYGLVSKTYSQEAGGMVWWLEELYLRPQYRGLGLGHEFFAHIDAIRGDAVTRLRLEVEPDNLRAQKLYTSLGFTVLPYGQMVRELPQ